LANWLEVRSFGIIPLYTIKIATPTALVWLWRHPDYNLHCDIRMAFRLQCRRSHKNLQSLWELKYINIRAILPTLYDGVHGEPFMIDFSHKFLELVISGQVRCPVGPSECDTVGSEGITRLCQNRLIVPSHKDIVVAVVEGL
jgi:hypothetical protein